MNDYFDSGDYTAPTRNTRARATAIAGLSQALEAAFDKLPSESELKEGRLTFGTDAGTGTAYAVTLNSTVSYTTGLQVSFKALNANTGAATINVNALGAKPIHRADGSDIQASDIPADAMVIVEYDADAFQLIAPAANATAAGVAAAAAAASAGAAAGSAGSASSAAGAASDSATAASNSAIAAAASAGAATTHIARVDNPHAVTKAQVGLTNVLNEAQLSQGKHQIPILASGGNPYSSSAAGPLTLYSPNAYDVHYGVPFDAAVDEYWQFSFRAPKAWNGSTLDIEIVWEPTSTNTGNVVWAAHVAKVTTAAVPAAWLDEDSVTSAGTGASGRAANAVIPQLTGLTVADGDIVTILIQRDADNVSDTYTADAVLRQILVGVNVAASTDA